MDNKVIITMLEAISKREGDLKPSEKRIIKNHLEKLTNNLKSEGEKK